MRRRGLIAAFALSLAAWAGAAIGAQLSGQAGAVPSPVRAAASGAPDGKLDVANWPRQGTIRFSVMLGEGGFQVGEARHEWTHDGGRYRMTLSLRTSGVAALLHSLQYEQRSEGRVGSDGLRPEQFAIDQSGKKPQSADFDWKSGQVTMRRGERTRAAAIEPGDQDLLSLWHQIAFVAAAELPKSLNVVSGRSAKPSVLEIVGAEQVSLPLGTLDTQRLRARSLDGKMTIDIWLAPRYGMAPVRIRLVDDDGQVLDHHATEIRLNAPAGAAPKNGDNAAARGNAGAVRH